MMIPNVKKDLPVFQEIIKTATFLVRKASPVITSNIVTSILAAVSNFMFLSLISARTFGQFKYFQAFLPLLAIFSAQGISIALEQDFARKKYGEFGKAVAMQIRFSLAGITLLFATGAYFYHLRNFNQCAAAVLAAVLYIPYFVFPTAYSCYSGKKMFSSVGFFFSLRALLQHTTVIALILLTRSENALLYIAAILVVPSIFNTAVYVITVRKKEFFTNTETGGAVGYGLKISLGSVLCESLAEVDKLLLKHFGGYQEVAIYSAAQIIIRLVKIFQKNIASVIRIMFCSFDSLQENWQKIRLRVAVLYLLSIASALIVNLLYPLVGKLLFPESYRESLIISQIMLFAYISFGQGSMIFPGILLVHKKMKEYLIFSNLCTFLRTGLMLIFVPMFLSYGVVCSSIIFFLCTPFIGVYLIHKAIRQESSLETINKNP
ncbi:MAG: oligosaccharide flippase family protein [Candidatus Wallbacteria bacterium]|nr:oligosaccharide flippase family protein [Candidatus Wallbacteria bacterium]